MLYVYLDFGQNLFEYHFTIIVVLCVYDFITSQCQQEVGIMTCYRYPSVKPQN